MSDLNANCSTVQDIFFLVVERINDSNVIVWEPKVRFLG